MADFFTNIKVYYRGDKEIPEGEDFTLKALKLKWINDQKVCLVVWDEPKKRNPLKMEAVWEHYFIVEYLERHEKCNVVVWTGADCGVYCSGFGASMEQPKIDKEICNGYRKVGKGMRDNPKTDGAPVDIVLKGLLLRMWKFKKISIIACNGMAIGGGANMALLFHDFIFLQEESKFRYPFIDLGITAEVGSSYFFANHLVGPVKAKELLMTGRWFTAAECEKWNLCNYVIKGGYEALLDAATKKAIELSNASQMSLRENKRLINRNFIDKIEEVTTEENRTFFEVMNSPETMKLMMAFKKKHTGGDKKAKL